MDPNRDGNDLQQRVTLLENNNEPSIGNYKEEVSKISIDSHRLKVSLNWTNLSYVIQRRHTFSNLAKFNFRKAFKSEPNVILYPQNGCVSTGSIMAIIGQSGSGKTTLLESLTGRRVKNLKGDITINIENNFCSLYDFSLLKIAFIPQNNCLVETLTVEESIVFASKIKNLNMDNKTHATISDDLLDEFHLNRCRNVRVGDCSGGQKKRLSVAMELVSKPTILVVDEPTSGLDSSSAFQCIQLLRKLTLSVTNPVAIIVTIHQPSAKILDEFHKLYLLSHNGMCIYNGPVDQFLPCCTQFNLRCPPLRNTADFAIEVASGDCGEESIQQLNDNQTMKSKHEIESQAKCEKLAISSIVTSMSKHSLSAFFTQTALLSKRAVVTILRDTYFVGLRLAVYMFIPLLLVAMYSNVRDNDGGCIFRKQSNDFSVYFSIEKLRQLQGRFLMTFGFIFITTTFLQLAPIMTTVIVIPAEMSIFFRERANGWYSCLAYYLAKTITEIPFLLLFTSLATIVIYFLTGQPNDSWRFAMFLVISLLIAFISEGIGLIAGAVWMQSITSAIFIAPLSILPFTFLSGLFVRIQLIPTYLTPITYTSFFRFTFESYILCLYGFNRCSELDSNLNPVNGTVEKESVNSVIFRFVDYISRLNVTYSNTRPILRALAVDMNQSLTELHSFDGYFENFTANNLKTLNLIGNKAMIVQEFGLEDNQLYYNIYMLCVTFIFLRILAYIVLCIKVNKKD